MPTSMHRHNDNKNVDPHRFDEQFQDYLLDTVIDQAPVVLFATDANGIITLSRGRALDALGLGQNELVGTSVFDIYTDEPRIADSIRQALAGETVRSQIQLDDVTHICWMSPLHDEQGRITGVVGVSTDITRRVRIENELRRLALYDSVTGLPNRNHILDSIGSAVSSSPPQPFVLIKLGIDRFREVNDVFGFHFGDRVLQQIGRELLNQFSKNGLVARTSGDQFAVLAYTDNPERDLEAIVQKTLKVFESSFFVEDNELALEASLGVVTYPGHGDNPDRLLRRAARAMQLSKDMGRDYTVYELADSRRGTNNLKLLAELREAVRSDQLFLLYQPKIEVKSGALAGVEALLRWRHPEKGFISPESFIPIAEQTGVIHPITQWVCDAVARQMTRWQENELKVQVAINISARSFHSGALTGQLRSLLEMWDIRGEQLQLEITETAAMADPEHAINLCRIAREMGIGIAIDDFGTGHSSLVYLKDLQVTHLKMDQSFIKDITNNPDNHAIVRSIINMGQQLGITTIAEGVEDQATYDYIAKLGCDQVQGYYVSHPLTADELVHWQQNHTPHIHAPLNHGQVD